MSNLARQLAQRAKELRSKPCISIPLLKPAVVACAQENSMDTVTRACIYSGIRDVANLYQLSWLVRQETKHVGFVLECLDDQALLELRARMYKARECILEGISFDDAGLIRSE